MNTAHMNEQIKYEKRRLIADSVIAAAFVCVLAAAVVVKDFSAPNGWVMWAAVGLFAAASIVFLILTRCPFCKKIIVYGAMLSSRCPHCREQLVVNESERQKKMADRIVGKGR